LGGHKHKFDAPNGGERDSWLAAVKKIAEEAKAKKDEILASESYKETLAKFSKYSSNALRALHCSSRRAVHTLTFSLQAP
jgi:hypothetical protein